MEKSKLQYKNIKFYHFGLSFSILIFAFYILMLPLEASAATISRPMQSLGLVGYWSFDVGKGTAKAVDMSGRGNNGTLTNMNTTAAWVGGKIGNALNFDGVNDWVDVGNGASLGVVDNITISAWVKPTDYLNYNGIVGKTGADANKPAPYDLYITQTTGLLSFLLGDGTNYMLINSNAAISLNTWTHIAVTRTGNNGTIYFNGVLDKAAAFTFVLGTGQVANAANNARIGSRQDSVTLMKGSLDEVRVYNRALSADEIKRLYRQTSPQMNASQANKLRQGLVGMWTFDGNDMSGNTALDRSGNGNNGTLTNGPKKVIGKIGQALNFDGSDDTVLLTGMGSNLSNNAGTISMWVKWRTFDADNSYLFSSTPNLMIYRSSSNTLVMTKNISGLSINSAFIAEKWYNVVFVWNSGGNYAYLDGIQRTSGVATTITPSGNAWISGYLGNTNNPGWNPDATIDEVRIYNRALSPAEIRQLYKAGSSFHPNVTNKSTIRDGLVGHWSFDGNDMTQTIARDSSGNGNSGTLTNGPKKAIGKIGQALSFDGVNDYVNISDNASLDLTTRISISAWIKLNSYNSSPFIPGIVAKAGTSADLTGYDFRLGDGTTGNKDKLHFTFGTSLSWAEASGNASIPLNTWTHVAVTYNQQQVVLYVNGIIDTVTNQTSAITANNLILSIGDGYQWTDNRFMNGLIDEVRVYNRALSPDEIKRLYNMGR